MKYTYAAFSSVVLTTAVVAVTSCSDPIDCTDRRDCPSDFHSRAGSSSSGAAGEAGATGNGGTATGTPTGDAGETSAGGSAGAPDPESCDGNADPATTACVIADGYGTFVAPYGNDDNGDGTQAKPFATVTKALSAVALQKRARIYVCAAEYSEPDTITPLDGSSIFGGFSCDAGTWAYDAPVKALLTVESPVGAIIDSAKRGVTLEDVRLDAADAPQNDTGASSFGLVVNASKAVALVRAEFHAGKGASGRPGVTPEVPMAPVSTSEQDGRTASCLPQVVPTAAVGGAAAASKCGIGGRGGIGYGTFDRSGASGTPTTNLVSVPQPNGGAAATAADPNGTPGRMGSVGLDGGAGKFGLAAASVGSFGPAGYIGAAGGNGASGGAGQGGGGGGASLAFDFGGKTCTGAGGGGGGAGGCGGSGGTGGGGGGASVGMLSWNSEVTLDAVVLVAKAGGAGSKGGAGLAGSIGSEGGNGGGGTGDGVVAGGHGGHGGIGGAGGPGAGGTGGPSLGLVYKGMEPSGVSGSMLTPGTGGALGLGGLDSTGGTSAPNGAQGMAAPKFSAP